VPPGPASSNSPLAKDAPNCVDATPPITSSGGGTASIVRRWLTAVTLLAALVAPSAASAQQTRPNILFVMTDDQTVESMKVMGKVKAEIQAPGTTFTNSIVTFPLCCPSRSTYLTGQYAHNHGVINNVPPFGGYVRLDHTNTLPVWLQRSGYRTMSIGRYLNGYGTQNPDITEIPPGWSDWISNMDPTTYHYDRWRMNDHGQILELPDVEHPGEYQTDYLGRRASEMVRQAAPSDQPFFLSLTFPAPHSGKPVDPGDPAGIATPSPAPRYRDAFAGLPLPRPPGFDEKAVADKPAFVRRRPRLTPSLFAGIQENYRQELESLLSVDDAVSQVMTTLRQTGELGNTLVIFTSDNGFMHGEHRIRAAKVFAYEPSIKVPLIMRGPGVPAGLRTAAPVANIDLAPTILAAARALPGRLEDGTSLFGQMADPAARSGRELLLEDGRGLRTVAKYRGVRNDRYVYIRYSTGTRELYDLRRDPYELANRASDERYARIVTLLDRRMRRLERCRGARACDASRPKVALRVHPCAPQKARLTVEGPEGFRVARVRYARRRGGVVRATVTMVDGRVATFDRRVAAC
jgi:N-acetylglucosamine-6-sulfatase